MGTGAILRPTPSCRSDWLCAGRGECRWIEPPRLPGDRAEWFGLDEARRRINPGQAPLLRALEAMLAGPGAPPST
jgi:predicted NUDIX family NTP pyrophosphohydrolase